jgi:two-component system, LuxR family, sensor kinase FixL
LSNLKQHIVDKVETYKDLFDNAHDLIHIVDPDGTIIYVNNAWTKILGYTQEEMQGKSIYSVVDHTDRDRFAQYRNAIVSGTEQEAEVVIRLLTKTGNIIYAEGFVSSKIIDGVTLYTRGIFRDITARLQNEAQLKSVLEKLKERESNLQQLLFHAPDAIIVVDTQSIIRYWNPKAEQVFGWTFNEVSGKPLTQVVIRPQYREAHTIGMKRYLATGEQHVLNRTIEIKALKKGDTEFFVALTISPTIQNGEPALIAFIRDIDQQKKDEQELEQKRIQLEASNRQLEQFAHVASHDMKEPVRKIMMFTDRLNADAGSSLSVNSRNFLQKIQKAAKRLTQMVDGVLTYSSLKAETLIAERINLTDVVKDVEADLELLFQRHRAILKYSDLPVIEGAPFLIHQLLYNLINNSLKFSRTDIDPVIEVSAKKLSPLETKAYGLNDTISYVKIIVSDNGIGFRQEYAEKIFQSFTRLNPKDRFEGTGLGLALCKMIVEKHGGIIQAFGSENDGAEFHLVLPAAGNRYP